MRRSEGHSPLPPRQARGLARTSMGRTRKPNVCRLLSRRALGCFSRDAGVVQRTNLGILRMLVCQESTKFKNVWTTHSKSPIAYERGRIYFDNYRCCVSSVASEPRKLYEMPKCSKSEKIEDALLWECPVGEVLPNPSDYKSSLIALTAHNWLLRISATTGKILEKIYLASYCKFRPSTVCFAVPCSVPCSTFFTHRDFGDQQKNMPPLLFEVSSLENAFQIGGHPWHYIITPNKKKQKGVFHICALNDNSLAKNGIQEMECCSLESDWIYFHPDASGRIIHVGPNQVKVLKLNEIENSFQHQISEDFVILANREKNKNENLFTVTASGRVVKKHFNLLDDDPEQETFKIVDYEDELDLLSVVAVTQLDAEGKAHLDFHCNEYGTLLKSIPLVESWDVTYSHEVYFDRDLVLHIEQKPNRVFSCYVYQMVCDTGEEEENIDRRC
ncbi:DDB1- and CUL4-associated factor 17 isoform X4 [Loxodonta africana]|uniref:DDB1- and CUL4-associated factor 17 isoform X4 n=1 Tax=Loxodonta africana TaxID=9785 RepID=UPI000C813715|nr:DDB1- and CUL4-associated factor 17 isoform X3 [Loxodonta africana]